MVTKQDHKRAARIAMEGPITGPVIVRETEVLWDEESDRPKGKEHKRFGFFDKERGIAIRVGLSCTRSSRYTPRHRHDCESVRYIIRGKVKFGDEVCGPGDCIYIPESVPYGPEDASLAEERIGIGLQFSGPSGISYPHPWDMKRAAQELSKIGKFEKGIYIAPDGREQDGSEAVQEHLLGRPLAYAPPRYTENVIMRSENYSWVPLKDVPGVFVKHLGYFNEVGPNIKLLKIDRGAKTLGGTAPCQQVRYVLEGEISFNGEQYEANSCMYFPAHIPYPSTASSAGAILFVLQLASPDGHDIPPFCLI